MKVGGQLSQCLKLCYHQRADPVASEEGAQSPVGSSSDVKHHLRNVDGSSNVMKVSRAEGIWASHLVASAADEIRWISSHVVTFARAVLAW